MKGRGSSCAALRLVRRCLAPRRIELKRLGLGVGVGVGVGTGLGLGFPNLKSATSMRAGKRDARCAASSRYLAHVGRRSVAGAIAAAALSFSEPSCA